MLNNTLYLSSSVTQLSVFPNTSISGTFYSSTFLSNSILGASNYFFKLNNTSLSTKTINIINGARNLIFVLSTQPTSAVTISVKISTNNAATWTDLMTCSAQAYQTIVFCPKINYQTTIASGGYLIFGATSSSAVTVSQIYVPNLLIVSSD